MRQVSTTYTINGIIQYNDITGPKSQLRGEVLTDFSNDNLCRRSK